MLLAWISWESWLNSSTVLLKFSSKSHHLCASISAHSLHASQIRIFHGKIASTVYKLIIKSLNNGINIAIFGHFSSEKCAKSDRTLYAQKRAARTHIPHTFRMDFARTRTRATAHRTCACAHAPSQLIPWFFQSSWFYHNFKIAEVHKISRGLSVKKSPLAKRTWTGNTARELNATLLFLRQTLKTQFFWQNERNNVRLKDKNLLSSNKCKKPHIRLFSSNSRAL